MRPGQPNCQRPIGQTRSWTGASKQCIHLRQAQQERPRLAVHAKGAKPSKHPALPQTSERVIPEDYAPWRRYRLHRFSCKQRLALHGSGLNSKELKLDTHVLSLRQMMFPCHYEWHCREPFISAAAGCMLPLVSAQICYCFKIRARHQPLCIKQRVTCLQAGHVRDPRIRGSPRLPGCH